MAHLSFSGQIACIGEAMVELMLGSANKQSADIAFAGDTLNTAIYLRRLLKNPARIAYISVFGDDPLSRRMIEFIDSESIDTQHITRSTERCIGLYAIETDATGERTFTYWRSQSAARTLFQQDQAFNFDSLQDSDILYLSAITLAILPEPVRQSLLSTLSQLRLHKGVTVVFDSNYRPALWESKSVAQDNVEAAWRITDIALPSIDDEMALFDDVDEQAVLARLHGYGVKQGALKRGALGPRSLADNQLQLPAKLAETGSVPVKIVDTTAAGDSFNAGYLAATLSGQSEQEALLAGHHCSLRVIAHAGAIIPKEHWFKS